MERRWRPGIRALVVLGGLTLVASACGGAEEDSAPEPKPISVKPNDGPIVAGDSEFLVSTGEPGRPTHLVKVGVDGQLDWPEDGAMIGGTQLDDGTWFVLNSSCQGTTGVCGDVGGITLSATGDVEATGDLWDEPGTYEVVGSSGSLVLVSVRTDTAVTAYWVDAGTVSEVDQAFRSAPYDAAAIRDAAEAAGGEAEYDTPRFRFCAGDDAAYVLSSPGHDGSVEPPSRTVEVMPSPVAADDGEVARLFEVDIDSFDARLAGALICGDDRLTNVTVGPSDDGGSEVTLAELDALTGEADERSVVTYDTPLVDLYGGGDDRALLSVTEVASEAAKPAADGDQTADEEPPSELVVVNTDGDVIDAGRQAPTGPASISLDGSTVLQPDGDSVQVDRIG